MGNIFHTTQHLRCMIIDVEDTGCFCLWLVQSMRGEVFYWRSQDPKAFQASSFPVFCQELENKRCMYGLPIFEYPGLLKVRTYARKKLELFCMLNFVQLD